MDSNSQLMKIWDVLSPADATRVVATLRQDAIVWAALAHDGLLQKAVDLPFTAAEHWTPARLALLSAGLLNLADGLATSQQAELPAPVLQEALHSCDMLLTAGQFPAGRSELESALLCAIALRERYRLTRSWSDVLREPSAQAAAAGPVVQARWRAVLACLPGLVPEPLSLLHALSSLPEPTGCDWACHCVVTSPLAAEDRLETLLALLRERSTAQQIHWCRHLRAAGHAELSQSLAAALAGYAGEVDEETPIDHAGDVERLSGLTAALSQRAALHHLAADEETARGLLEQARRTMLHAYAGIQVQIAGLSAGEPVWADLSTRELVRDAADTPLVAQNLLLGVGSHAAGAANLTELLPEHDQPALSLLYRAQIAAARGDLETAQELARQSVPLFLKDCAGISLPYAGAAFAWNPATVLQKLEALGLVTEACQVAEVALTCRPADQALIRQSVMLYQTAGESARALDWARLSVMLSSDDLAARRTYAVLCEAVANWEDGLRGWEAVLSLQANPPAADQLGLARCAYHCGLFDRSLQICHSVLEQDADNGPAEGLLGEIALRSGRRDEAVRHLSRATLLAPEEPRPWLSLAGIYRAGGDTQREMETLHAAVLAVPESGDLHFALAKTCLELDMPSEALPHLQEAARLIPNVPEVAWNLGKTLSQLGHARQARRVLEAARAHWPSHPQVALADAETLIEAGDLEAAITPLEVAVNSDAPESGWFLLYARALLGFTPERMVDGASVDAARLERAAQALQTVLEGSPQHFEAGVLLAETLQAQVKTHESFTLYSALVEDPRACLPEWRWRVQAGFGQVALANHQVETAVAALREATQAQPENIALHQMLTLAYRSANLAEEAAQSARQTLQLDSQDLGNLTWYIDTMKALGKVSDTIDALQAVTQLAPERAGFWNLLAQVQAEKGNATAARSALQSLLKLEHLAAVDFQHAAANFTLLGEGASALACLNQAIEVAKPAPAALLFEVAALRQKLLQPEAALEAVQAAAAQQPESLALHVFQADLLAELNQLQPALDCLERALRLLESQPDPSGDENLRQGSLSEAWWRSLRDPVSIYTRFALLLRAAGTMGAALNHAEKALERCPASLPLRCLAAELARGMLNYAKAEALTDLSDLSLAEYDEDDPWLHAISVLRVEMALDRGLDAEARHLALALSAAPDTTRSLALQARLLNRAGKWSEANNAYAAALRSVKTRAAGSLREIEWDDVFAGGSRLALAEAALDLEFWGEALKEMEAYTAEHPQEALAHLRRARALVLCAERQHQCAELRSTTHAPGADALSSQAFERFERAIQAAARLASTIEVSTWQARGRAAFQPGLQHAPAVAKLPNPGEHAPALMAVLRLANNAENAIRIMPHYPQSPALQLELALCYHGRDALKGLQAARSAVESQPDRPLHLAARALLAQAAGEEHEALLSIQTALTQWPDEPQWQAWAAELCRSTGDERGAMAHYEQCLALDPSNTQIALSLGRLYLSNGQSGSAVTMLERACLAAPDNVDALLLLAQARRIAGDLAGALENAQTSARLAPDQVAPKLMCGEIALQVGKPSVALEHARAALALDPADPDAVLFLSRVCVQTGALSDGLAVLEKALPVMGSVQPVLLERANLIHRLYGPQVALGVFMELGQMFPQDAQILSLLAQTQADCGDAKGAERSAFAAYHINPNLPQLNVLLGRLQRAAGQLDQAIHFYSEAIRQSPADVEPYLDLGEAYLDRREHLQALRTYQQAIKIAPRDFRPFYQAANVLRDSKDYIGAEAMLRRAAELAPGDLNIRRQLGAVIALNLVHNSQEANAAL